MAEPAGGRSRLWLRLLLAAGVGLALGLAALLTSTAAGAEVRPELCAGIGVAGALLVQLVRETAADPQPLASVPPVEPPVQSGGNYFTRLRQLERRLEAASRDGSKYDRNVRPVLARLAIERLRQKYGIDPRRQPVQAREVLGEQLWSLTIAPPEPASPAPSHAELSTLIALIEGL
jgi:hypothetical protein